MSGWIIKRGTREVPIPDEATLKAWAEEGRFSPSDLIFHPTLQQWLYAQDVIEIRHVFEKSATAPRLSATDISKLASSYRQLVLLVGLQLPINVGILLKVVPLLLLSAALFVTVLALAVYAARTAAAIGSSVAPLWAVAMLMPSINIITLLVLSSKATRACRANGIDVGLLGPRVA